LPIFRFNFTIIGTNLASQPLHYPRGQGCPKISVVSFPEKNRWKFFGGKKEKKGKKWK